LFEAARVGVDPIVVEVAEVAQDLVEIARVDAGLLQLAAQPLGVVGPLAVLAAELADVVRVPTAVAAAVGIARRSGVGAVVRAAAAVLAALRLLPLALTLALLALLTLLSLLAVLALLT